MEEKYLLMRVALNIKNLRKTKGFTQEYLAGQAGLAPRHIQKIEAAQVNMTLHTLYKLANALCIEPFELLK